MADAGDARPLGWELMPHEEHEHDGLIVYLDSRQIAPAKMTKPQPEKERRRSAHKRSVEKGNGVHTSRAPDKSWHHRYAGQRGSRSPLGGGPAGASHADLRSAVLRGSPPRRNLRRSASSPNAFGRRGRGGSVRGGRRGGRRGQGGGGEEGDALAAHGIELSPSPDYAELARFKPDIIAPYVYYSHVVALKSFWWTASVR